MTQPSACYSFSHPETVNNLDIKFVAGTVCVLDCLHQHQTLCHQLDYHHNNIDEGLYQAPGTTVRMASVQEPMNSWMIGHEEQLRIRVHILCAQPGAPEQAWGRCDSMYSSYLT